ncbi:MAG TPA: hypothetical protein VGI15_05780, partial [Candidatus Cybelea sp.]
MSRVLFAAAAMGAAALAACAQVLPGGPETGLTPLSSARLTSMLLSPPAVRHHDRGGSWMLPDAPKMKELLYVSDWGTDDVFVYNDRTGALIGRLTGFSRPYGQCVDKGGNVWITNLDSAAVKEYAHGGATPLKTLHSAGRSAGCSVDPTTGNLAVANVDLPAELQVYKKAAGAANVYKSSACEGGMWSPGYEKNGNLYVEGSNHSIATVCELAHGGAKLLGPIKLVNFTIGLGGGVMWDGTQLALTDQYYTGQTLTALYQVTEEESGSLKKAGQTVLTDSHCGGGVRVPQPFVVGTQNTPLNRIRGRTVLGGNLQCLSRFDIWRYPAGGGQRTTL